MGQEIAYCAHCGCQLRSADFDKGGAFRVDLLCYCKKCAPDAVKSLPPEKIQTILQQQNYVPKEMSSPRNLRPAPELDVPLASRVARHSEESERSQKLVLGGIGTAALGAALGLGLLFAGGRDASNSGPEPGSSGTRVDVPLATADRFRPGDAGPASSPAPDELALTALRSAREYARTKPEDLVGQVSLYQEAVRVSRGTRLAAEVSAETEALQKKQREWMKADLAVIDEQIRVRCAEEAFGAALDALEKAWERHRDVGWTSSLGERVRRVSGEVEGLYATLEAQAREAKRAGVEEQAKRISDRVARWKLPRFSQELEKALSLVSREAPPPPPASKEAQAWQIRWESAMAASGDRDVAAAVRILDGALPEIKEAALRKEALDDLALLRSAGAALDEGLRALSAWPKGSRLSFNVLDEAAAVAAVDGIVLRSTSYQVEISQNKECVLALFGEIPAASLVEILKQKSSRPAEGESRALALLCLQEGDAAAARRFLAPGSTFAEKYWAFARKAARPEPGKASRESLARRLFYQAERESLRPDTALAAAGKFKDLLNAFKDSSFVRRNASAIAARSELPKEFFFLASDLAAGGSFKASSHERAKTCWTSASDSDAPRLHENSVELSFPYAAAAELRCWIYVGGCCAETTTFSVQITELVAPHPQSKQPSAMEPGGDLALPVKQSVATTRSHASHGGPKQPSHWGWVPIPLPKFASPGLKRVRVLTRQQGFSVGFALVSSARASAPRDAELGELEKQRTDTLLRFGGPAALGAGTANPADVLFRGDFRSAAVVQPAWIVSQGEFPIKFDGQLEFDLSGDPSGKISEIMERVPHDLPIRVSVDVERTRGPKGMLAALRLHCYKGEITKVIHADQDDGRYVLYGNKTPSVSVETPGGAPRRERWTIDLGQDGDVVWLVDGKEVLRSTREKGEDAYRIILSARAKPGLEAGTRVRFGNLTVERLNR
jgi:hypothetical protein